MSYTLIVFTKNWADEFDVYGFEMVHMDKDDAILYLATNYYYDDIEEDFDYLESPSNECILALMENKRPFSMYFGTNEEIEWDSFEDYLNDFKFIELTGEEAQAIARAFDRPNAVHKDGIYTAKFGWMPCF